MSRTPHPRGWPGAITRITPRAGRRWQPLPGSPAQGTLSADICPVDQLSFWRIVNIPHKTWMAALDHWQLTGVRSELRLGPAALRGPAAHDPHFGTCQIQARLWRGPLRAPLRMRLEIDHWSATATALALIPCQPVQPTTSYFRAGHRLLDALIHALPQPAQAQARPGRQAQHLHRQTAATPAP